MPPATPALTVLVHIEGYAQLPRSIDQAVDAIRAAAGPTAMVHVTSDRQEAIQLLSTVEVAFGHFPPERLAPATPPLRWLHIPSAGADTYMIDAVRGSGITITASHGVYSVAGAEHICGLMLYFNRRLQLAYEAQKEHRWDEQIEPVLRKLSGQTIGIVGLGDIGTQLAIRAKAFGMHVLAIKRRPGEKPPYVDQLWGLEQLDRLLEASDHVALILPLTPHTRGLIGADALARMRTTAYLYNIGRGALVDEPALIRCLDAGRIAGAGLDVFVEEPLPPESPLWRLGNVLLTPHLGASSQGDFTAAAYLFADNLRRYRDGEDLVNLVDFERWY